MTFNLFSLSILELDKKLFLLVDILSQKITKCQDKTTDDIYLFCTTVSKFVFYYFSNKINEDASLYVNQFEVVATLLNSFMEIKQKYSEEDYKSNITQSLNILFAIFKSVDINTAKLCASKIFNFLLVQDNYFFVKHIIDMNKASLLEFSELENIEKCFVFYFMSLQFLTRKTNDILVLTKQINEITEDSSEKQKKIKAKANLLEIIENVTSYVIQFFFGYSDKPKVNFSLIVDDELSLKEFSFSCKL